MQRLLALSRASDKQQIFGSIQMWRLKTKTHTHAHYEKEFENDLAKRSENIHKFCDADIFLLMEMFIHMSMKIIVKDSVKHDCQKRKNSTAI